MSRKETIPFVSPMQEAFINAAVTSIHKGGSKVTNRVERVAKRQRVREVPAVNTKLSYRTAQKLLAEGVIE